jgi:hypothetical protein
MQAIGGEKLGYSAPAARPRPTTRMEEAVSFPMFPTLRELPATEQRRLRAIRAHSEAPAREG